jgi:hypothetical protein
MQWFCSVAHHLIFTHDSRFFHLSSICFSKLSVGQLAHGRQCLGLQSRKDLRRCSSHLQVSLRYKKCKVVKAKEGGAPGKGDGQGDAKGGGKGDAKADAKK